MNETLATLLTIALVAFVVWVFFTGVVGAMRGDIVEGAVAAFGVVVFILFIGGAAFGVYHLIDLIWSGVTS